MKEKIEDLRKKAFLLYGGPHGIEMVNQEIKKMGVKEDQLNEYQVKIVLNSIIKHLFIDFVGLEKSKELLAKDTTHVAGYKMVIEADTQAIHVLERFHFREHITIIVGVMILILIVVGAFYILSFNSVELCEGKKAGPTRDHCFILLSLNKANITFCEKLGDRAKQLNCFGQVGIKLNDTKICDRIPSEDTDTMAIHDKCVMCIAFKLGNVSMCRNFMNPIREAECEHQLDRGVSLEC